MNSQEIQKACRLGDLFALKSAIKSNPTSLNELDSKLGWAPLYRSTILGNLEVAELLLALGADPNIQNRLGETSLHQAAEKNSLSFTELLLQYKAKVDIQQNDGDTPLHLASAHGNHEIVKILLEQGANPNIPNTVLGRIPLHYACEKNHFKVIEVLLSYNSQADFEDKNNVKPLDLATKPEIIFLVKNAAGNKKNIDLKAVCVEEDSNSKDSVYEPESEKGMTSARRKVSQTFSFGEVGKSALYQ